MKLIPAGAAAHSEWEDGLWIEKPGYPAYDGSWIHPPQTDHLVPEFEFEEGEDKNKNEPAPILYIGSGNDAHIRIDDDQLPHQLCRLSKEGRTWWFEALAPNCAVHHGDRLLESGDRVAVNDGDVLSLVRPPTPLAYRILIKNEDNWYIDLKSDKEFPNKYPSRFPFRTSLQESEGGIPAPEELKRLAWQTDQMRRRSEEDQVRVSDWSAFSQYVKRHYYKYGIECVPWCTEGRLRPADPIPPGLETRRLPSWVADIVAKERQLPGFDRTRILPYASTLHASGKEVAPPLPFRGEVPRMEDLYDDPSICGPAVAGRESAPPAPIAHQIAGRVSSEPAVRSVNPHLQLSFREWLESLDDSLFLMQYHDRIVADYDSLEQIHEIYWRDGELSKAFFEDTNITKLGHRRIFEKWFRDRCR